MRTNSQQPFTNSHDQTRSIVITATFMAEPVQDVLAFWMKELNLPASIEFAPYNQVFQQLLDPGSLLGRNSNGVNLVLIRVEDWQRMHSRSAGRQEIQECLARNASDLIDAVRTTVARSSTPLILVLCPASPAPATDQEDRTLFRQAEERISASLSGMSGVYLVSPEDFDLYPVDVYHDPLRDQLGHIPYTPLFYAALGTILARKTHALTSPQYKVVVLDCDNTLWKGAVGEDGIDGITISFAWRRLQQFMVELASTGVLLCLCSKNDESDVLDVFEQHPDMVLKRDHLVSWRINWKPKSENIKSLAQELNLGLDSFIFLDDNPIECAEIRAACPAVLTLRLPIEGDIPGFLKHSWAFDRLHITSEDQQRTAMYKQEIERNRFQEQALTIKGFLAGLDLRVAFSALAPAQLPRVAQLTQRTNQFNFTTIRRTEGDIKRLSNSRLECRVVEVSDRFGDYGLVGAMIFTVQDNALEIDTFLLSCRVLGRGVEHQMLNHLGEIARQRQLSVVNATLIPSRRNRPAQNFLDQVTAGCWQVTEEGWRCSISAETAVSVAYTPEATRLEAETVTAEEATTPVRPLADPKGRSQRFERIATELFRPEQVLEIAHRHTQRRGRSGLEQPLIAPRTGIEVALTELWASLLRFDPVGIKDNFFDLGGTSLLAVDLFAQIERRLNKRLPLTALLEAPTVEQLARLVAGVENRDSLVLIRDGGGKPPLFLVHDGDGETMLYRNLALLMKTDHAVYGLQPCSRENVPLVHTRVEEMAAHHIDRIRSVQPHGPYFIGGMCAGGVIAFEIARQLQRQQEKVAMVALLDAADVAATPRTWQFASQRIRSFSTVFKRDQSVQSNLMLLAIITKALRKARNLAAYLVEQRVQALWDEIRVRLFHYHVDRGLHLPRALAQIPVRTIYLFAAKSYQPDSLFDGELTLFRATDGEGPDEPYIKRYTDPLFGWAPRATRGVRAFNIPGGHSSMLQEPHVSILAEQMQSCIDDALTDDPITRCAPALIQLR